jgi:hypothetical protein
MKEDQELPVSKPRSKLEAEMWDDNYRRGVRHLYIERSFPEGITIANFTGKRSVINLLFET